MPVGVVSQFLAWAMLAVWLVFVVLFMLSHPRAIVAEVRRAHGWWVGLLLQALGYLFAFSITRPFGTPHTHVPVWLEIALALSALVIALISGWLVIDSVRTLGKQWGFAARIVSGHELVTSGPFRIVRHPIYSGMLGMLIATAIAYSSWLGFILSITLYLIGTSMRIRKEEYLLRETFGRDYEAYAQEVPALVPGLF